MKKAFIGISILQIYVVSILVGQSFTFHSNSPFGIELVKEDSTRAAQTVTFFDYDGDGDLDLLLTGLDFIEDINHWSEVHFFIEAQENIGTRWSPLFGERFELFESFPYPVGYFLMNPGDLNNDSKIDLITAADIDEIGNATLQMLINTGVSGSGQFDVSFLDAMGIPDFVPESFFKPELVDLDQDGDLDLMSSGFDPPFAVEDGTNMAQFFYARNVGTKSTPNFQGWYSAPYNLVPDTVGEILTHGDIDKDGDMDFIGAMIGIPQDSINFLLVHLNTPGSDGKPAFTTPLKSPYGLPSSFGLTQFAFPEMADIDGDGDLDLFVFEGDSDSLELQYYTNNLCEVTMNEMLVPLCEGDAFMLGGNTYTEAGHYTIHLQGQDGCDSIIQLSITLVPPVEQFLEQSICEGESFTIGIESFTVAGNYTVFITAANGCDSIVNLTLVVEPMVTATLNELICEGETFVIGNETFTTSGQYTIVLDAISGCDTIVSLTLIVDHVDNSVTANQNVLTANLTGGTYQWINCDSGENIPGANAQSFTVLSTGNYGVIITDQFGCSSTSECSFVMITSIEDERLSNAITIYPNPAENNFFILNESQNPVSAIVMTNLYGQKMAEYITNGSSPIDISSLAKGVYLVKMKISGHEIIKKLIII